MIHITSYGLTSFFSKLVGRTSKPFAGMNPFGLPVALYRDKEASETQRIRNHEMLHWQQSFWLGIIGFWILYQVFQWIYGYKNNPFENEAYNNDTDFTYLFNRHPYAWIKYFNKSTHPDYKSK